VPVNTSDNIIAYPPHSKNVPLATTSIPTSPLQFPCLPHTCRPLWVNHGFRFEKLGNSGEGGEGEPG